MKTSSERFQHPARMPICVLSMCFYFKGKYIMWEDNDKKNYEYHKNRNLGQIHNDAFSNDIKLIASNPQYKTFLEIGTWNGLGSTRAFANGFQNRSSGQDYIFYSLECNVDKCADALKLYKNNLNIHILNEVIWNEEPSDFYDIFPQARDNALFKKWNEVDIINMKECDLFLKRPEIPDIFDVILLDGGEFTTYYEFQILKNRCKLLLLDDINSDKCKLIVDEIRSNPKEWKILRTQNVRNGYLIAEKLGRI